MWRFIRFIFIGLVFAASGCGGSGADSGGDAGSEVGSETVPEGQADAGTDAGTEADSGSSAESDPVEIEADDTEQPSDAVAADETDEAEDGTDEPADIDLSGCAAPALPGFPDAAQFSLVNEEELFRCFQTDSFVFTGSFESEITAPDQLSSIDFISSSVEADGERRYRATGSADGVEFEVVRIDNLVYVEEGGETIELDLDDTVSAFQLLGLGGTNAQLTLAGVGLTVVEVYGGAAQQVGEEQVGNRTAIRWEADGAAIASTVNSLGVLPGTVAIDGAEIVIWADENGQVMKVKADVPADGITVGGIPVLEIPSAADSGFPFGFVYEIEYAKFGEPLTIEAPS